jgi:hypothetical protein
LTETLTGSLSKRTTGCRLRLHLEVVRWIWIWKEKKKTLLIFVGYFHVICQSSCPTLSLKKYLSYILSTRDNTTSGNYLEVHLFTLENNCLNINLKQKVTYC